MARRVVITGIGMITPLGDAPTTWRKVKEGESGIGPLTRFDPNFFKKAIREGLNFPALAGEVKDFVFNAEKLGIDSEKAKKLDRAAQFAVVAAKEAVADSGISLESEPRPIGVVVGSTYGGGGTIMSQAEILVRHKLAAEIIAKCPEIIQHLEDHGIFLHKGKASTFLIPMIISSSVAAHVGIVLGVTGPTHAVNAACASGAVAIGDMFLKIRHGLVDVGIAGGAEDGITPQVFSGYGSLGVYSSRNSDHSKAMCPFDRKRDGFVASEGAGIVVLEEYEHAKARGAHIYGEMIGYGANADAFHITRPDSDRLKECILLALADAKINHSDVSYINAHGTSTVVGDVNETVAIMKAFGPHARKLMVSSTKSELGHMIAATGAVELILTALVVQDGVVPPTINLENPDPECNDLDFVPNAAREAPTNIAISDSYGFGGLNACLVVKKFLQ